MVTSVIAPHEQLAHDIARACRTTAYNRGLNGDPNRYSPDSVDHAAYRLGASQRKAVTVTPAAK